MQSNLYEIYTISKEELEKTANLIALLISRAYQIDKYILYLCSKITEIENTEDCLYLKSNYKIKGIASIGTINELRDKNSDFIIFNTYKKNRVTNKVSISKSKIPKCFFTSEDWQSLVEEDLLSKHNIIKKSYKKTNGKGRNKNG